MPKGIGRSISIALRADTKGFGKSLKQSEKDLQMFKNGVKKVGTAVAAGFAVMGAAALTFAKSAVQAAADEQKSSAILQKVIENNVKGYKGLTHTVEKSVTALEKQFSVTDDELRPAFSKFLIVTKNVSKSQKLMRLALDVSKGSGKKLEMVVGSLSKAYKGNNTGLTKLGLGFTKLELKTMTFEQISARLAKTFKGAAAASAQTFQGKLDGLNIAWNNFKERVGIKLIPVLEKLMKYFDVTVLPMIEAFANVFIGDDGANKALDENAQKAREWGLKVKHLIEWIRDHTDLIKNFAKAIAAIWVVGKVSNVLAAIARLVTSYNTLTGAAGRAAAAENAALTGGGKGGLLKGIGKKAGIAGVVVGGALAFSEKYGNKGAITEGGAVGLPGAPTNIITRPKTPSGALVGVSGGTTVVNNFNINGAVDPEASRRAIQKVLQMSNRRMGPVNLVGSGI